MPKYMAHLPSDTVSNQLQWRMSHIVASFSRLATMKIIPITVLRFMLLFVYVKHFWVQRYIACRIFPNFWDKQHENVMNGGIYYSTDNYLRVCGQVNLSITINIVCSLLNIVPFVRRKLPLVLSKGWIGHQNVQMCKLQIFLMTGKS